MSAQEKITRYWHTTAREYDAHWISQLHMGAAKQAWAAAWRSALPDPPADVLDVATGTGQVALLLAELGYRVVGIDLADGMLAVTQEKSTGMANPPVLKRGDAIDPQFAPASFDAVVNRYLLWTLREPHRALANWRTLLRPGGVLVAVDGHWFADGVIKRDPDAPAWRSEFERLYDEPLVSSLPWAEISTVDPIVAAFCDAGFYDVRVTPLPEVERLERASAVDTTEIHPQFMISGKLHMSR
jgi:ubiquinone/menaquinone biosynthesis C-methylase UbiE